MGVCSGDYRISTLAMNVMIYVGKTRWLDEFRNDESASRGLQLLPPMRRRVRK